MRISQLIYFESVCRLGSVTKAAKELHISQPAISMAIKELESEFGLNLFIRQNMQLFLTESGRFFYREIQDILSRLDQLSEVMKKSGSHSNVIRIAVPPVIGVFCFPVIFNDFREKHPALKVIIQDYNHTDACNALDNGLLDFAVIIANNFFYKNFQVLDLMKTQLQLCVSKKSRFAGLKQVSLNELAGQPLILMQEGSSQHTVINTYFKEYGLVPNVILYTNQLYTILSYISTDSANAFLIREMCNCHPDCLGIPVKEPLDLTLQLLWKKELLNNPRFSMLLNYLKTIDTRSYFHGLVI